MASLPAVGSMQSHLIGGESNAGQAPERNVISPADEGDLSYPMSHYFISSSHNTYLTGNQVYSISSVDSYMKVLKAGCRCVEVDVWDGKVPEDQKIEQEIHGIRDRLHLKSSSSRESSPQRDKAKAHRSHHSIREKLGLKKAMQDDKIPVADDEPSSEAQQELDRQAMPTPWKALSEPAPEPRVLHGHTLTKEVSFRRVCQAISATAFASSDLPLIVSLEVHCSLEQQAMMVEIMQDIWREYLLDVTRFADGTEPEYTAALPPPGLLQRKILIKVKYTPPEKAAQQHEKGEYAESGSSGDEDGGDTDRPKPAKKKGILDELSLLGVYTRSFHFKSFDQKEASIPTHVFALSENKLADSIEKHSPQLAVHNTKYFMRAYPKGFRVSSSNLNPIPLWRHGVQMVALNWQSCDKSMMLNEGMFGGTKGWVLKPKALRDSVRAPIADASTKPSAPQTSQSISHASPGTGAVGQQSLLPKTSQDQPTPMAPKYLSLRISFYTTQHLPAPHGVAEKNMNPYIKCILHTEALPSQRESRSRSASPSPPPQPRSSTKDATPKQSARERASSLLHDRITHRRGLSHGSEAQQHEKDIPPTKAKPKFKARTDTLQGASPDFKGQTIRFDSVPVDAEAEYLAFVRLKLMHDVSVGRDQLAGWACARLGRLRQGWGMLHLKDEDGEETEGRVLVEVKWELTEGV